MIHGCPRPTADVDVMVHGLEDQLDDLCGLLRELQAVPLEGAAIESTNPTWLRNHPRFPLLEFTTAAGGLDIDDYGDEIFLPFASRSVTVNLGSVSTDVVSIDDLLALKRRAGRDKDVIDIDMLRQVRARQADRDAAGCWSLSGPPSPAANVARREGSGGV